MTGRLHGKAAFITGGGAGIGRAISLAMAREGAKVAIVDIDGESARACAEEVSKADGAGTAFHYECDVSDRQAVDAVMSSFVGSQWRARRPRQQRGDVSTTHPWSTWKKLSCAGCSRSGSRHALFVAGRHATSDRQWRWHSHQLVIGGRLVLHQERRCVYLDQGGDRRLDTPASCRARTLRNQGECARAGPVSTPGASRVIDEQGWRDRAAARLAATAEQIGSAAVFLASEEASTITGVTLKIDGGITIAGP